MSAVSGSGVEKRSRGTPGCHDRIREVQSEVYASSGTWDMEMDSSCGCYRDHHGKCVVVGDEFGYGIERGDTDGKCFIRTGCARKE